MSELEMLKDMCARVDIPYIEEKEKMYNEYAGVETTITYLHIPACRDEFLILGFDEEGILIYADAGDDWDGLVDSFDSKHKK